MSGCNKKAVVSGDYNRFSQFDCLGQASWKVGQEEMSAPCAQTQAIVQSTVDLGNAVNSNLAINTLCSSVSQHRISLWELKHEAAFPFFLFPLQWPIIPVLGADLLFHISKKVVFLMSYDICDN